IRIHAAKSKKGLRKVLMERKGERIIDESYNVQKGHATNNEDDQVTEKNSLTMARELDKSRAEVANAEKPNPAWRARLCLGGPKTLKCVNEVNKAAEDNWKRYTNKKDTTLQGVNESDILALLD
ncbi:phospholipase D delta, partial [Tanacetum coccineum]